MVKQYVTYEDKAKAIIKDNMYMIIATCKAKRPWAAPVFYAYDDSYNLYFLSAIDSRHAEDIFGNPYVAVSIFDSSQQIGQSDGVQIEGKAAMLEGSELSKAIELYVKRLFPKSSMPAAERYPPEQYSEPGEFRFFKITISKLYTTSDERRTEIRLGD